MQAREREREAGGPPVPHNSLDLSVIDLSETVAEVAVDTQEVFQNEEVEDLPHSPSPRREMSPSWGDATLDLLLQDTPGPGRQDSTGTSPRAQQLDTTLDLLLQDTPRRQDIPRRQDTPRRQDIPR